MITIKILRQILGAHSKTAVEALYLELGCVPFRYIIQARRIMFLHYLLNLKENEMLKLFFEAQVKFPAKGDWIHTVLKDIEDLEINMDLTEIQHTSKEKMKNIVKKAYKEKSFYDLINVKKSHSKIRVLNYTSLEIQEYLKINMKNSTAKLIFKLRTKMLDVKDNFRGTDNNPQCNLCEIGHLDSQENLLICPKLSENLENLGSDSDCKYSDLFSSDAERMKVIGERFEKLVKIRQRLTSALLD